MFRAPLAVALAAIVALPSLVAGQTSTYKVPPAPTPQILDAPPTPTAILAPTSDRVLLLQPRSMPTIAEQAEPLRRLAGVRFAAASGAPVGPLSYVGLSIAPLDGGRARPVAVPLSGAERLLAIGYAPDGSRFAFAAVRADRVELWLLDMATGQARRVPGVRINTPLGVRCEWTADSRSLACLTVPATRGEAPKDTVTARS